MGTTRRALIIIVVALIVVTVAYVGVYIVQRLIVGDFTPFVILGMSVIVLLRLFFFRGAMRRISGLSGYRRYVRKDE